MKRLSKILLSIVSTLAFMGQCAANDGGHYTIAGAVPLPGNYDLSHLPTVRMADLLGAGRLTTEEGTALILRGTPLQIVSSETISPESDAIETQLAAGDIVMFRRYDGATPGSGYALVMAGGSPSIITLQRGQLPLTHVLQAASLNYTAPVTLLRTAPGKEGRYRLNENDLVKDGDIIELSTGNHAGGLKITEAFVSTPAPLVPGKQTTAPVSLSSEPVDIVISPRGRKSPSEPSPKSEPEPPPAEDVEAVALVIPEGPRPSTLYVPLPENQTESVADATVEASVEAAEEVVTAIDSESESSEYVSGGQMELRPVDPDTSLAGVQDSTPPIHTASLENTVPEDRVPDELFAESETDSANTQESSGSGVWNSLFVCGLLFASGLIVAGWAKTRNEQQAEYERSVATKRAKKSSERSQRQQQLSVVAAHVPEESMKTNESDASAPVEASEADESRSPLADDDCPVLMAGIQETVALKVGEDTKAVETSPPPKMAEQPGIAKESGGDVDEMTLVEAGEWYATDQPAVGQKADSDTVDSDGASSDQTTLEDLVQNRLPMDLKQASFPLRIALYGKPSGPKRLRIDAAHSQIAAPHMAKTKRRAQRKETVAAAEQSKPRQQPQKSNDRESPSQNDKSRFDKALNFLEEQSEK